MTYQFRAYVAAPSVLRGTPWEPSAIQAGRPWHSHAWTLARPVRGDMKDLSHLAVPACPC